MIQKEQYIRDRIAIIQKIIKTEELIKYLICLEIIYKPYEYEVCLLRLFKWIVKNKSNFQWDVKILNYFIQNQTQEKC